jgi:hypothetical protein
MRRNKGNSTNFQIIFPKLPVSNNLADSKELTLHIHGAVIPGVSVELIEGNWLGMVTEIGGPTLFEDWTASFAVDNELYNWHLLYQWLMLICNKKDNPAGEVDDYKIDATLKITDNFNANILKIKFIDVWPKALGAVNLSYREGQSLLESDLTLSILRYEVERI